MRLSTRDWIASVLVAAGVVVAAGWWAGVPAIRTLDIRAAAVVVMALGVPASAAAVVPGFAGLIHGSREYLLGASGLGLLALGAAVLTVLNESEAAFATLVFLMVVLWIIATVRHAGGSGLIPGPSSR